MSFRTATAGTAISYPAPPVPIQPLGYPNIELLGKVFLRPISYKIKDTLATGEWLDCNRAATSHITPPFL